MNEYLTLIHDHWRSTRKFYLISFAVAFVMYYLTLAPVLNKEIGVGPPYPAPQTLHRWLMAPQGIWVLLLLITSGDNDDLSSRLPRYLMRLPLTTWKIVCARLTFGVLTNTLFALVCYSVTSLFLPERLDHYLFRPPPVLILAWPLAYLAIQTYAWCFGSMGIIATLTSFFACFVAWNGIFYDFKFDPANSEHYSPQGMTMLIALSFVASVIGVGLQRKGRFSDLRMPTLLKRTTASPDTLDSDSFNSPAEALRWYQHREQSNIYPKLAVAFSLLVFVAFIEDSNSEKSPPSDFLPVAIYLGINIASYIAGTMMLLRGWGKLLKKDGIFLFVRPVTSMEMVTARWEANAKAVLLTVVPLFAIALVALFFDTDLTDEGNIYTFLANHFSTVTITFFACTVMFLPCAAIWGTLWIENVMGMCVVIGVILIPVTFVGALLGIHPEELEVYQWVATVPALSISFTVLFAINWRKKLISVKHLSIALALTPFVFAGTYAIIKFDSALDGAPLDTSVLIIAFPALMILIVLPIITGPVINQWARHRK